MYFTLKDHFIIKDGLLFLVPSVIIIVAILLYNYFEVKFINIGKKVTKFK